jgi:hypothetical protein
VSADVVIGDMYFHGGRYTEAWSYKMTKCLELL